MTKDEFKNKWKCVASVIYEKDFEKDINNMLNTNLKQNLLNLFEEIKHGDIEHQEWLKDKILNYINNNERIK